jgi:hypothetical protein
VFRYAPGHYFPGAFFESVRLTTPLTEHTDFTLRGRVRYSPFYSFDLAVDPERQESPDLVPAEDVPVVAQRKNMNLDVGGDWRYRLGPRSTMWIDGGMTETAFFGAGIDQLSFRGGIRFAHSFSPNASLQIGYGYREWRSDTGPQLDVQVHDIRAGVRYVRPLPFTRPTRLGFSVGSGAAQTRTHLRVDLTGEVFLTRELSRSWGATVWYRRGLEVRSGLNQPLFFFGDTVAGTIAGALSRRTALYATASYVYGSSLLAQLQEDSSWWSASTVLSVRLLPMVAAYAQGTFMSQRFSTQLGPFVGLPRDVDRYSTTLGLIFAVPLLR